MGGVPPQMRSVTIVVIQHENSTTTFARMVFLLSRPHGRQMRFNETRRVVSSIVQVVCRLPFPTPPQSLVDTVEVKCERQTLVVYIYGCVLVL